MNIYEKGGTYKGFLITKNKKSIEKFKNKTDFKSFEQVQALPEFAGVLGNITVLIDIDDSAEADKLLEIVKKEKAHCVVIQTTRGKHFLFRNNSLFTSCSTHAPLAIGVTADIKLGTRNSYEVLKVDGKMRKMEYPSKKELESWNELDEVPRWLTLLKDKKDKPDFLELKDGDGRNQGLFNYILILQKAGLDIEECRKTIRLINEHLLTDPLADEELEVVLRDEAFKANKFYSSGKFKHDEFAEVIKTKYHIIKNDNNLLIYDKGIYINSNDMIEKAMVSENSSLRKAHRAEVIAQLKLICDEIPPASANLIAFNNGLLDIGTGYLSQFDPSKVVTNKIPWNYNPDAYSELADTVLNNVSCGDSEIRLLLEEMIGACFYRSNTLGGGKAFILTGTGANGKSTFLDTLKAVLGKKNYSALDLKEMSDKFSKASMFKVLANIGDDISDEFNADMSTFKKVVTGQSIKAENKGEREFFFDPYCKLIFSANTIPRIKDRTGAAQRRMIIIPFNANFAESDKDHDPTIIWKLTEQESIEYFIRIGVEGLQRVLKNKQFSKSSKVEQELKAYAEQNNPILSFVAEIKDDEEVRVVNEPVEDVFKKYKEFCLRSGYTPLAKNEFSKQFQRVTGLKSKQVGKQKINVFIEPDE